ncbi:MAG: cation-translocating P-type ATPase [Candidatus Thermoplasmatota archaeon]
MTAEQNPLSSPPFFHDLKTSLGSELQGLSEQEAAKRLQQEGYNELPAQQQQHIITIFLSVLLEPMLLLLVIAGIIYLFIGEKEDALMLLFFVLLVIGITFYQQRKTKRALEALKNLASPRALVIRNGQQKRIPGREIVRGDILILREGDRVPADAQLMYCSNLTIDESLLTGESIPVRKCTWTEHKQPTQPGGDEQPYVYSGTLVVQGHGIAQVTAIGLATEMGKIGKTLEEITPEETHIKQETTHIITTITLFGAVLCILVIILYGLTWGNWIEGFLAGLSLSMALLPEEFSVVLLVFLSLGAWRMSKQQVLTRTPQAIEMLGSATVLCVDKTGTLTENKMILSHAYCHGSMYTFNQNTTDQLPESFHDLFEYGYLTSQKDPFDPLEKEIKAATERFLSNTEHIHQNWILVREYPLSQHLLALSHVWQSSDKRHYTIAAKGSPEAIIDLCHLSAEQKQELMGQVQLMAEHGLRVLGVAQAIFREDELPDKQHDFAFRFLGLLGFIDPVRPTVAHAIKECYTAGIRVIMITGDYPGTAQHIARQIGLRNSDQVITGEQLRNLSFQELQEHITTVNIFARVVPEQKLRIVEALKANGDIVAMTGDGVNDAPALKSAHIGIAMGHRGTDVAREASDLVILTDDFSLIVRAVRMGRKIFDNLKKSISYIFSVHIPIAGMVIAPILMKMPLMLLPVHIAFLELIIDPACSVVFEAEPEEKNIMHKQPRNIKEKMFGRKDVFWSTLQGLSVFLAVLVVYIWSIAAAGYSENQARTLTFITLVVANVMLIVVNLSWSQTLRTTIKTHNKAFWLVIVGAFASLFFILGIPSLRELFRFTEIAVLDLVIVFLIGLGSVLWIKLIRRRPCHQEDILN